MISDRPDKRLRVESQIPVFTDESVRFFINFIKDTKSKTGCTILPEFIVTKNIQGQADLERIKEYLKCGEVQKSNRSFGKRGRVKKEYLYEFSVLNLDDIKHIIIPFLKTYPLSTHKKDDLILFEKIIHMMSKGVHLDTRGVNQIYRIAQGMTDAPARVLK